MCTYMCIPYLASFVSMCIYLHMERDTKKIIKRFLSEGWEQVAVQGSHHKFRRGEAPLVVPHPNRDLPIGTARSIAKASGWL